MELDGDIMTFKLTEKEIEVLNEQLGKIAPQLEERQERQRRMRDIEAQQLELGNELLELERQVVTPIDDQDGMSILRKLLMDKVRAEDAN